MTRILILLTIIFLTSCTDDKVTDNRTALRTTSADTTVVIFKQVSVDSLTIPSRHFLRLAKQIDSSGYIWDTARIKKVVHYFRTDSIVVAEKFVFYKMNPDDSWVLEFYDHYKNDNDATRIKEGLVNIDNFKNVISIFGYYYKQKEKANLMTDGYIEEWLFPTIEEAEKAVQDVARVKEIVFFNTESFCCRIDKRLYIFHVRASGFSIPMKDFFRRFVKDNNATVPNIT